MMVIPLKYRINNQGDSKMNLNQLINDAADYIKERITSTPSIGLISDHINYSGSNPLIGQNLDQFGPRFPDLSNVYTKELRTKIMKVAEENGIALRQKLL